MSGDRLAEIETWARDTLSVATILRARDVLALVEIAKAARDVLRIVERDTTEVNALRAALVRLCDGGDS